MANKVATGCGMPFPLPAQPCIPKAEALFEALRRSGFIITSPQKRSPTAELCRYGFYACVVVVLGAAVIKTTAIPVSGRLTAQR